MERHRLPPIDAKIVKEFKKKVDLAFPGEKWAYGRETEEAITRHMVILDKRIKKNQ